MIGTIIEIFATIVDILFLVWFVPKFNGSSVKKSPLSLIWAGIFLFYQLIADHIIKVVDIMSTIVVFSCSLLFSFSVQLKCFSLLSLPDY